MIKTLHGKVALVTGGSRGIGKGIAIALAKEGATVYISGRSTYEYEYSTLPGSINKTEQEIIAHGGKCKAIYCDHTKDSEVFALFKEIYTKHDKLDLLINNAWGGYEFYNDGSQFWEEKGFWEAPVSRWDNMFSSGVRAAYVASSIAAKEFIKKRQGIIINLSYWASQRNDMGVAYGTSKAATDKMTAVMAHELTEYNIPVICLYPGLVRTESVLKSADHFDLSNSESPKFVGRVISALATDPQIMLKTGKILIAAKEAIKYGIKDIDGSQPQPLNVNDAQ